MGSFKEGMIVTALKVSKIALEAAVKEKKKKKEKERVKRREKTYYPVLFVSGMRPSHTHCLFSGPASPSLLNVVLSD